MVFDRVVERFCRNLYPEWKT